VLKLAALSVDLDEVDNYLAIHGLAADILPQAAHEAVYARAVPRLLALLRELDIPGTFFAIGRDLARPAAHARLREIHGQGHEIGNHTLSHYYDLTRRPRATQVEEVRGGADAIEDAIGPRPRGFRAPGYTITDQLFGVLREQRVFYDSSVFPCPPYYSAKLAALALMRLRGRKSRSIVDDPRVLRAPADPYRVGEPYYRRGDGLLELPVGVTGAGSARLPYLGTSVVLGGTRSARLLTRLVSGRPLVNLVLHGMDVCDADEDGLAPLAAYQPDLRQSLAVKRAALAEAVQMLKARGYAFVTLHEAARHFAS
jgi:peptidoglycan/xylan/chitin deacetylase (PgdA/CDA1 family)